MPRRFTPREEQRIGKALKTAGHAIMGARGVRKTSIDELVRTAGISKGSFYRFFSSKEALALEVLAEWERDFHAAIEERFRLAAPRGTKESATVLSGIILEDFPRRMVASGLQGLLNPEEIDYLARAATAEEVRIMDEQDIRLFQRLRPLFFAAGLVPAVEDEVIIAGLRMIFEAGSGLLRGDGGDESGGGGAMTTDESDRVVPQGGQHPAQRTAPSLEPHHFHQAFGRLLEGFLEQAFRQEKQHQEVNDE